MIEKTQKTELNKLTVRELVHYWVNHKILIDYDRGKYKFTPDRFYFNNRLQAIYYKKYFFISDFNNSGAFGNGIDSYFIKRAIPGDNVYSFNNVTAFDELEEIYIPNLIKKEFVSQHQDILNRLAWTKDIVNNNRVLADNLMCLETENTKSMFIHLFGKKIVNKVFKEKIKFTSFAKRYSGWIKYRNLESYTYDNFTLDELDNADLLTLLFTEEEREILKLKNFIESYCKICTNYKKRRKTITSVSYTTSLKAAKQMWFSDKREEWMKLKKQQKLKVESEKQLVQLKKKDDLLKSALLDIEDFRNGKVKKIYNLTELPFTVIKLLPERMIEGLFYIYSSLKMRIDIEEAKKALRLFRLRETKHDLIQGFVYKGVQKKVIPYLNEAGEVAYREEDCLVVGCHVIPESEINSFLNFYKLDW